MASLMNGLSSLGAGVSAFAGQAGLEEQKADLMNRSQVLADQLATTRESAGRQEAGQIAATAEQNRQTFESGQNALNRSASAANVAATEAGATSRTAMTINAEPPEIRAAKDFAQMTQAERNAFTEIALTKAGVPAWMAGGDNFVSPTGTPPRAAGPRASSASTDTGGSAEPASATSDGSVPVPPAAGAAVPSAPDPGAPNRNEKALEGVPSGSASLIKGMVDGRISPPSSMALSKPMWQGLVSKAAEYDPTFDQTTWAGRVATRKSFTAGQDATAVTALNTALSHASNLDANFTKLNNFGGILTPLNGITNATESFFGDQRQTVTAQNIQALASEARKVFAASGGGNLTELENWEKSFPMNGSPSQQHGALTQFVDLLDGRLQSLADKYNRGMGRTDDPMTLLQPAARASYQALTGRAPQNAVGYSSGNPPSQAPASDASASAKPMAVPSDPGARVKDQTYTNPNGVSGVWNGSGWDTAR